MTFTKTDVAWVIGLVVGAIAYHFTAGFVIRTIGKTLTAFLFAVIALVIMGVSAPQTTWDSAIAGGFLGYALGALADPAQWSSGTAGVMYQYQQHGQYYLS
jgi:small-conductance mechanosensitive channel